MIFTTFMDGFKRQPHTFFREAILFDTVFNTVFNSGQLSHSIISLRVDICKKGPNVIVV